MRRIAQVGCLALFCASATAAETNWPRVYIKDQRTAGMVRIALAGAALRLEKDRCQQVFANFLDERQQPLQARLVALDQTSRGYLEFVVFLDGSETKQCENRNTVAYTAQGYRTVFVCGRQFAQAWSQDPRQAEAIMIHETMHTLGLGENPPSSSEITHHVMRHCPR